MNKICVLISLIVFSSLLLGMSSAPKSASAISSDEQVKNQVAQILDNLKSAYESKSIPDFSNLLAKDFEDRLGFQANLQNYFIAFRAPELMIVTDTVLVVKDKISVQLHWFKKNIANSGAFSKIQGSSQFIFNQTTVGLKLLYLRGDNPFY